MSDFENVSDCIVRALQIWANYIETGDVSLSREDVIPMVKAIKSKNYDCIFERRQNAEICSKLKDLDEDQKALVARLRAMADMARKEASGEFASRIESILIPQNQWQAIKATYQVVGLPSPIARVMDHPDNTMLGIGRTEGTGWFIVFAPTPGAWKTVWMEKGKS